MTTTGPGLVPVERALISVADKTGLEPLARRLADAGVSIVASDGTAAALDAAGIAVRRISDVTGAPAMLEGRVKTIHPLVMGAVLGDPDRPGHRADLVRFGIEPVQLVVVVPYPPVSDPDAPWESVVERVDIGGPALIRAAAKNHARVAVVVAPDQYDSVAEAVASGGTDRELRRALARRALFETASLDAAVLAHLEGPDPLPERLVLPLRRVATLRYGENPDQRAAAYALPAGGWWRDAVAAGADVSVTNLADAEAAVALAADLRAPAAVVVKHTNPCGAAEASSAAGAFEAAWSGDERAAYGGVVAFNAVLDGAAAAAITGRFVEVVVAPVVTPEAREILASRRRPRLLEAPGTAPPPVSGRSVAGGLLLQTRPDPPDPGTWRTVAGAEPSPEVLEDLRVAWAVAAHSASNAVAIVTGRAAVGVGAGDQARVGAAERAVARAGSRAVDAAAATDGFFPFPDGLEVLADAGVTAVVEPGGSRRDDEVIDAARRRGVTLVFTGVRRFRH